MCVCVEGGGGGAVFIRGSSLHIMYSMTMPLLLQGTCWVCQSSASHSTKICKSDMCKLPRNTVCMHTFHHWVQSPLYIAECEMSQAVSSVHGAGVVPVFFIHSLPSTMLPSMAIASISTLAPCHKQPHGRCDTLHILTDPTRMCTHTCTHTFAYTYIYTHVCKYNAYARTHAHTHTHMYACTHTWRCRHTNWPPLSICVCDTLLVLLVSETHVYIDGSPLSYFYSLPHTLSVPWAKLPLGMLPEQVCFH